MAVDTSKVDSQKTNASECRNEMLYTVQQEYERNLWCSNRPESARPRQMFNALSRMVHEAWGGKKAQNPSFILKDDSPRPGYPSDPVRPAFTDGSKITRMHQDCGIVVVDVAWIVAHHILFIYEERVIHPSRIPNEVNVPGTLNAIIDGIVNNFPNAVLIHLICRMDSFKAYTRHNKLFEHFEFHRIIQYLDETIRGPSVWVTPTRQVILDAQMQFNLDDVPVEVYFRRDGKVDSKPIPQDTFVSNLHTPGTATVAAVNNALAMYVNSNEFDFNPVFTKMEACPTSVCVITGSHGSLLSLVSYMAGTLRMWMVLCDMYVWVMGGGYSGGQIIDLSKFLRIGLPIFTNAEKTTVNSGIVNTVALGNLLCLMAVMHDARFVHLPPWHVLGNFTRVEVGKERRLVTFYDYGIALIPEVEDEISDLYQDGHKRLWDITNTKYTLVNMGGHTASSITVNYRWKEDSSTYDTESKPPFDLKVRIADLLGKTKQSSEYAVNVLPTIKLLPSSVERDLPYIDLFMSCPYWIRIDGRDLLFKVDDHQGPPHYIEHKLDFPREMYTKLILYREFMCTSGGMMQIGAPVSMMTAIGKSAKEKAVLVEDRLKKMGGAKGSPLAVFVNTEYFINSPMPQLVVKPLDPGFVKMMASPPGGENNLVDAFGMGLPWLKCYNITLLGTAASDYFPVIRDMLHTMIGSNVNLMFTDPLDKWHWLGEIHTISRLNSQSILPEHRIEDRHSLYAWIAQIADSEIIPMGHPLDTLTHPTFRRITKEIVPVFTLNGGLGGDTSEPYLRNESSDLEEDEAMPVNPKIGKISVYEMYLTESDVIYKYDPLSRTWHVVTVRVKDDLKTPGYITTIPHIDSHVKKSGVWTHSDWVKYILEHVVVKNTFNVNWGLVDDPRLLGLIHPDKLMGILAISRSWLSSQNPQTAESWYARLLVENNLTVSTIKAGYAALANPGDTVSAYTYLDEDVDGISFFVPTTKQQPTKVVAGPISGGMVGILESGKVFRTKSVVYMKIPALWVPYGHEAEILEGVRKAMGIDLNVPFDQASPREIKRSEKRQMISIYQRLLSRGNN